MSLNQEVLAASEAYNPGRMDPTGMKGEYRIPQCYSR